MTVTHLTDILVPDTADLLNVGGALGDSLQGVAGELELILDVGGGSDLNTGLSSDAANVLLTEEVTVTRNPSVLPFTCRVLLRTEDRVFPYRISISAWPVSAFFSMLTLMGKWA